MRRTGANPCRLGNFSWLGQAQRLKRLWSDHLLILAADLQLSANPLVASEQFVIGGGPSVRGYQQNIRFGDNGYRFSVEQRIPILKAKSGRATLQLAPFVDLGQVWNNPRNPFPLPSQTFLIGVGAGLIWTPVPEIAVRLDAAPPDQSARSGRQSSGQWPVFQREHQAPALNRDTAHGFDAANGFEACCWE